MLAGLVPKSSSPVIIAGDLNCTADAEEMLPLLSVLRSANNEPLPTYPAHAPSSQIDYILLDQRAPWTVESVEVLDGNDASDHRPLLTVIRIHN
jgi:endonuclease/exonuclease/phosphatase family metal-dependent hydrolase